MSPDARREGLESHAEARHNGAMKVVIAGGSGFLGRALVSKLVRDANQPVVLTRRARHAHDVAWVPGGGDHGWRAVIDGADAVINLAGESSASGRWTPARKVLIERSRLEPTRALVGAIAAAAHPPAVFLSASAVGIYGTRGDEVIDESGSIGHDYLAHVGRLWEDAAAGVPGSTRLVLLRTGIVLDGASGALPPLALPFRLFAGGPAGTGAQYMSWIHAVDWVAMVQWALSTPAVSGPMNLTAPAPVPNEQFAKTLGRVLGRPAFVRAPAFALRLLLGEMADALVLGGQRVVPAKAQALGFTFRYTELEAALRDIYPR
jgi:uncharacterized protein (TIGR01777 family)